jgi:hypothetical protein
VTKTVVKDKPRKRSWWKLIAAAAAITLVAAIARLYAVAVVTGLVTVGVLVLLLRAKWVRCMAWLAARRRRRTEGPASWGELRRRASEPADGGIPICFVTRGRTR